MKIEAQKLYKPNSIELISAALATNEIDLEDQVMIVNMIFSTNSRHSNLLNLLVVIGMPRYFKGKEPH